MSYNFFAEQYDEPFRPHRLGNWGPPRWSPSRPRPANQRPRPADRPLADLNGRLLPGFKRPKGGTPWAVHVGTWDMPHIITRKDAAKLNEEPPPGRFLSWLKRSSHQRLERGQDPAGGGGAVGGTADGSEGAALRPSDYVESGPPEAKDDSGHAPYVPGQLTEHSKRHESHKNLVDRAIEDIHGPQPTAEERFLKKLEEDQIKVQESESVVTEEHKPEESPREDDAIKALYDNMYDESKRKLKKEPEKISLFPRVTGYGYQYARKLHMENLQHQPLPDTIADRVYQKLQMEYPEKAEGSEIIVKPYAVAWKGYGSKGPNGCTKMRVHRPKTSIDKEKLEMPDIKHKTRPATSTGEKVQVQKLKNMSQMDLAICWDFRPIDPTEEPKQTTHIDGSNGSKGPAIFTLVQTPRDDQVIPPLSNRNPVHPNAIFTQNIACDNIEAHRVPYFELDMSKNKKKDSCDVPKCPQHNEAAEITKRGKHDRSNSSGHKSNNSSVSRCSRSACGGIHGCGTNSIPSQNSCEKAVDNSNEKLAPLRGAWGDNENYERKQLKENMPPIKSYKDRRNSLSASINRKESLDSYEKSSLSQGKMHQSSPNLSENISNKAYKGSTQSDCTTMGKKCKNNKYCQICRNKTENKTTKKSSSADSGNHTGSGSNATGASTKNSLKIPKMRDPYMKKNYIIPTLSPPFSLWRDASSNNGYPEHWRLASVYQHAYKPVEQRRKPLIASVYQ